MLDFYSNVQSSKYCNMYLFLNLYIIEKYT